MIEEQEKFLRDYKLEEKISMYVNSEENAYNKIHTYIMESIKELFGIDYYPIEKLLFSKKEAYTFVKNMILKYWNTANFDVNILDSDKIRHYEKTIEECLNDNLIDQISKLSRCNFQTFLNLINVERFPFKLKKKENYLLSIYCIPIGEKYLVHASFNYTEKFDYMVLQEKFKSLVQRHPLTKEELSIITKNYKNIAIVIGGLALTDKNFLENNIQQLYDSMENSKFNQKYKKEIYLHKLDSAMKLVRSEGNLDYHNVFDLDLKRTIDASFYKKLNYSEVENLVKEIVVENYLNHFQESLTEIERTYVYYCLFTAAYAESAYKTVIQLGEYLLENDKIRKYQKELILNYNCINGKDEIDYLLRRYDTALLSDFFSKLLDAYVKEKQYVSALLLLKNYNEASSFKLRQLLTKEFDENMETIIINQFKQELEGDICLLITDYDYYMFNEEQIKEIIAKWHLKIQEKHFAEVIYKPLEAHILNIIMTVFANGNQKLTTILIDAFSTYFSQSKDMFEEFYHFIMLNSKNANLIDKQLLNSLKNAEVYLSKIQNSHVEDVKEELFKVKKIYQNSGTILNDYLTNKKLDALSSILRKNLDEETYNEIIDEVITEMKNHLDAANIKKEEIESYYERLKSIELLESVWDKLEEDSKVNLATGMYLYDTQKAFFHNTEIDFSASIINWCIAVENELKHKLYKPFKKYCDEKEIELNIKWNFLFGNYIGIFGKYAPNKNKETFYDFCKTIYPTLSRKEIIKFVENLRKKLEIAREQFRNKAAHPEIVDEKRATSCYDLFFPTQNLLKEMLEHYK